MHNLLSLLLVNRCLARLVDCHSSECVRHVEEISSCSLRSLLLLQLVSVLTSTTWTVLGLLPARTCPTRRLTTAPSERARRRRPKRRKVSGKSKNSSSSRSSRKSPQRSCLPCLLRSTPLLLHSSRRPRLRPTRPPLLPRLPRPLPLPSVALRLRNKWLRHSAGCSRAARLLLPTTAQPLPAQLAALTHSSVTGKT